MTGLELRLLSQTQNWRCTDTPPTHTVHVLEEEEDVKIGTMKEGKDDARECASGVAPVCWVGGVKVAWLRL
jgi:hypothetical protein